jgi:ankyrin repeat protein
LEPLSPHHLLFAASQDPDSGAVEDISMDLDYLLSACKNLLLIDPLQNTCRLSHLSVYEYFEKHVEKASVSHAWLARVCLATVMAPHAENIAMCRPGESFTEWATTRYDKYVQNSSAENGRDYPENPETYADSVIGLIAFTCYSNYYWPLHVKAHGDEDPCRHLAGLLALFLGSMEQGSAAFDSWAEKLDYYWQYPRIEQSRIPRFNPKDHKPIYTMAFFGFYNILSDWWDAGYSDVNHTSYLGVTLLKAASLGNSLPVVKWLLDAGADVNASDSVWGTALIRACSKGNYEVAELLLQRGADPDVVLSPCHYPGPENAISDSISQGNILITQLLLANGATLPDGFCIHTAAYARNKEMLSLLMQPSVRFKEPRYERNGDYSGVTDALIEAVKRNDEEIVRHMVKEGADVEAYTLFQQVDAITAAAFLGLSSMVQVLVDLGANVNTPLVSLIQAETTSENVVQGAQREAMVMLLLSLGADPSIPGGYERGALASAVHMCQFGIAKILLEHDPSLVNTNEGKSLLPVAVSNHDLKTVQLLIDYGADVNAPYMSEDHVDSESEQTESDSQERKLGPPLLEAANAQNHAITLLLLEKGASVEIDSDTASPLTAAAEGLAEEVVKTLLDWKMNVHHQHRESGQNALMALIEAIRELYKRHAVAPWQDQPSASFAETMDKARRISNLLLEHHIDVNARGGQYGSALAAAASVGDFAFTELLLKHGADVHARGGKDNVTALIAAVEGCRDCRDGRSYEAIIDLLLENGANVNTPGGRYGSALSAAVDWAYERDNDRIRGGGFNWDYSGWYEEIPFNEDDITAEMQREEAYLDRGRRIAETLMGRDTNLTERAENAETEGNLPQRQ